MSTFVCVCVSLSLAHDPLTCFGNHTSPWGIFGYTNYLYTCIIPKSAEAEFAEKLKQMEARHEQELSEVAASNDNQAGVPEESASGIDDTTTTTTTTIIDGDINQNNSLTSSSTEEERLRKLEKARRKRDAKKEKERQRQDDLEREAANAGPSMRAMELETLDLQLKPLSLRIVEIPSDGNCLYRAVAAQCGSDYIAIRKCISVCVGMWA